MNPQGNVTKTMIRKRRGAVHVPAENVVGSARLPGLHASDIIHPGPGDARPPRGLVQVSKASIQRAIDRGCSFEDAGENGAMTLQPRPRPGTAEKEGCSFEDAVENPAMELQPTPKPGTEEKEGRRSEDTVEKPAMTLQPTPKPGTAEKES